MSTADSPEPMVPDAGLSATISGPARVGPPALAVASGWLFVLSAAAALAYGLWSVHGSGEPLAAYDVAAAGSAGAAYGPLELDPGMNPLRILLRAGHAPVGSRRIRYRIALVEEGGRAVWEKRGALGNTDDKASVVWSNLSLATLDAARPGRYFVEARFEDGSMDDLREARVLLRRNVVPADPIWLWGLVAVAAGSLIAGLTSRRRPAHGSP